MTKLLSIVALVFALAACGRTAGLEPQAGKSLPQKPALASRPLDANELLALPPYAAPNRVDELNKKGEVRTADRFDMPPADGTAIPPAGADATAVPSTTGPENQDIPR